MAELPPGPVGPPLVADEAGSGPPVVLLHGQPGTAHDWSWLIPLMVADYRVIAPDRPGYGRTGGRATGFAGNARAVVDLMDRLAVEQAVLVGHSWAGGVALAVAVHHPDRVSGMVLVSSVAPGERFGWDDRLLAAPIAGEAIAAVTIGGIGLLLGNSRVQSVAGRRLAGRAGDAVGALTLLTRSRARVWQSFVTEQRALLSELRSLAPELGTITAPTVIVHGARDRLVPPEVARSLERRIPRAGLHVVEDAGHLLPHDHPAEIRRAVDEVTGAG